MTWAAPMGDRAVHGSLDYLLLILAWHRPRARWPGTRAVGARGIFPELGRPTCGCCSGLGRSWRSLCPSSDGSRAPVCWAPVLFIVLLAARPRRVFFDAVLDLANAESEDSAALAVEPPTESRSPENRLALDVVHGGTNDGRRVSRSRRRWGPLKRRREIVGNHHERLRRARPPAR